MWTKTLGGSLLNLDGCRSVTVGKNGELSGDYKVIASGGGYSTTIAVTKTRAGAIRVVNEIWSSLESGKNVMEVRQKE